MGDAARVPPPRWGQLAGRLDALSVRGTRFAQRIQERSKRMPSFLVLLFAATAAWILLWAGYDLVLLTGAFPSAPGYQPDMDVYLRATWWVMFPISTFLIFRRHAWLPILALAVGGWEDILFYWIQGHPVPASLAYLPQTPTAELLYLRAVLFLIAAGAGAFVARLPATRIRFVPLEIIMLLAALFVSFWIFVVSIPAYAGTKAFVLRLARREHGGGPRSGSGEGPGIR